MSKIDFRYLIPEPLFEELIQIAKDDKAKSNQITQGWLLCSRNNNFAIVKTYDITKQSTDLHIRPKSWMRLKKQKLYQMRRYKEEDNYDIVYQFHTHPSGIEELHEVDLKILEYLTTGVVVIITPDNIVGWFYDKRETKRPFIDKMLFEIINES